MKYTLRSTVQRIFTGRLETLKQARVLDCMRSLLKAERKERHIRDFWYEKKKVGSRRNKDNVKMIPRILQGILQRNQIYM